MAEKFKHQGRLALPRLTPEQYEMLRRATLSSVLCVVAVGQRRLDLKDLPSRYATDRVTEAITDYLAAFILLNRPRQTVLHNEARTATRRIAAAVDEAHKCLRDIAEEVFVGVDNPVESPPAVGVLRTGLQTFFETWTAPRHNPKKGKQGSLFSVEEEGFALTSPEGEGERVQIPQGHQPALFDMGRPDRKAMEEKRRRELAARAARKAKRKAKKQKNPPAPVSRERIEKLVKEWLKAHPHPFDLLWSVKFYDEGVWYDEKWPDWRRGDPPYNGVMVYTEGTNFGNALNNEADFYQEYTEFLRSHGWHWQAMTGWAHLLYPDPDASAVGATRDRIFRSFNPSQVKRRLLRR